MEKRNHTGPVGMLRNTEGLWALRVSQEVWVKDLDTKVVRHVDPGKETTVYQMCQGITYLPNWTRV
eukprot:14808264-Ditylum_brightwellii.AAC.1